MMNLTKRSNAVILCAAPTFQAPFEAPMNKPIAKPRIREENERAILTAAEAVFAEQGFGGATMAGIAARAGVPKSNVHYYFPTKERL
jgi:TetR/AcrR family transcriptional regulator